jgi:hypothetical protein
MCWTHTHIEWVDDPIGTTEEAGFYGPGVPTAGGRSPAKSGNQLNDAKLRAAVDRAMTRAKDKLKNANCTALLDRIGVNGTTLKDVMHARRFDDPRAYLTTYLTYVSGGTKDCPGDAKASTKVGASTVAICRSFGDSGVGMNSVYLIHEMMHSLGYGEAPMPGWPTSAQITQDVVNACGNN